MNMRDYPTSHFDKNESKGTGILLFYISVTVGSSAMNI